MNLEVDASKVNLDKILEQQVDSIHALMDIWDEMLSPNNDHFTNPKQKTFSCQKMHNDQIISEALHSYVH